MNIITLADKKLDYTALDIVLHQGSRTVAANLLNSRDLPRDGIAVFTNSWGSAPRSYLRPSQPAREYFVTAKGVLAVRMAVAGVLLLCGVGWGVFVLVPSVCVAIVGGLASAWLFLTALGD